MLRRRRQTLLLLLTYMTSITAEEQIEGVFSEKLTAPGYHLIKTIPKGATSINVTELTRSKNFLAVRLHNGRYLFNGNYIINSSSNYKGAGTTFTYIRRKEPNPESFYAPGPLNTSVDVMYEGIRYATFSYNISILVLGSDKLYVSRTDFAEIVNKNQLPRMLVYQKPEPQIFFEYKLPKNVTKAAHNVPKEVLNVTSARPPSRITSDYIMMGDETGSSTALPRGRKIRFAWKAIGFTKCSKTCGGGFQSNIYICIRQRNQKHVHEKKCRRATKPQSVTVRCNNGPCAPQWQGGPWSKCSATCGNGTRTRELQCIQEMPDNLHRRVDNRQCAEDSSNVIPVAESCYMPDCGMYTTHTPGVTVKKHTAPPRWKTEEWSPCSTTCGDGIRKRAVTCVTLGKDCNLKDRPATEEACNLGDCKRKLIMENEIPEALMDPAWLYSTWPEKCSAECGAGVISRRLYCENYEKCDDKQMPTLNRTCFSSATCGQWFIGPWTKCSSSCDIGIKTREVVCISRFLGHLKVVNNVNCHDKMPDSTAGCRGPPCYATWFMSDWSNCSHICGGGTQERKVRCIGPDGMPINANERECDEEKRPVSKRNCNETPCRIADIDKLHLETTENENMVLSECEDTLTDCWKIRQRHKESKYKCQIEAYKKGCCKACRYFSLLGPKE